MEQTAVKKGVRAPSKRQAELDALKARILELEKASSIVQEEVIPSYESESVASDDYVKVMSLLPYMLNLCTQPLGKGNVKTFTKFGEVKKILYKELVDIIESNPGFTNAGYFYIMNPYVIRQHGLEEAYAKILTKEQLEKLLTLNSDDSLELYKSANPEQQEVIIELLAEKLRTNFASVNLNIIDKLSRLSKVNILAKAGVDSETLTY